MGSLDGTPRARPGDKRENGRIGGGVSGLFRFVKGEINVLSIMTSKSYRSRAEPGRRSDRRVQDVEGSNNHPAQGGEVARTKTTTALGQLDLNQLLTRRSVTVSARTSSRPMTSKHGRVI